MYTFKEGIYTDVRIEDVHETRIQFTLGKIDECAVRKYKAGFIRVFDGQRWYYASTSEVENIQQEIDTLSKLANLKRDIQENAIYAKLQANTGTYPVFENRSVTLVPMEQKLALLKDYFPALEANKSITMWNTAYMDQKKVKYFYSSKGANLHWDTQRCGFRLNFDMAEGDKKFSESFQKGGSSFEELENHQEAFKEKLTQCEDFLRNSVSVEPGKYTVILSPLAAGIFAHESFGHKSEADFMVGDENMKKEWAIGKKVGSDILSIIDDGNESGNGYTPFDDEGNRASKTWLIKDGILQGRLHSSPTAADLEESATGNARALNFEFEPIVRMTTTYIGTGTHSKEQLFKEVKNGLYIDTIRHGSGMSTFTMAPSLAYRIRDGKITEPVRIAVISGTVFDTLSQIDGLSDQLELLSFVTGGCGKMDQAPLPVGFGGPYVRVNNMDVQ